MTMVAQTPVPAMTSRERVLAALRREPVDRTPLVNPTSIATVELMDLADARFPEANREPELMARLAENPQAYLSRAAVNASLDLIRSRQRARTVGIDETPAELMAVKTANPETQHADRELQTLIRQAVGRLGATAAEMFVLRYYEGYDNREIAKLMGTSQMVVGVVLHRARTKLRKEIGHYLEKHHQYE